MERYMTPSEFMELVNKVNSGKFNYKKQALKRLATLANQAGTDVDVVLLYYMAECERLFKENEEMKKKLDAVRQSAKGTMNPHQVAVKLGDYKPAYKSEIDIKTILALKEDGWTYKQIAKSLKGSESTIYRRIKEYKENTEKYHSTIVKQLDL